LASHERYAFQRGAVLISSLLEPLISIPILMLGFGSVGMMCTVAFLGIAQLVAYMTYCLKVLKMRFTFKNPQFGLLKEIYIFSFFVFLNDINSQFNWSADKFLLGIFKGTDEVAVYALSSQVNTMFCTFGKAVATMFVPRINRIVADGCDKSQLNTLFARVGRVQTEILMLIILGFTFAGKGFIALWGGEGYEHSYYTALLLIYSALPEQLQSLGVEIQMAMNKHKFRSVCYFFIGLANVAISIPLCRAFGAVGSATGTAISLFIGTVVVMNVYYVKAIGLDAAAFWKEILRTVPGLAVSAAAGFALTRIIHISSILSLAAFAVIFTLIYCGAMWLLSLNDYEKGIVKGAMAKLKK
jgi:O-antigen/teichoic acid export membrane protein